MPRVGIRKCSATKMLTTLLQEMFPSVQKVTIGRTGYGDEYCIKVKRPSGFLTITGEADTIMKTVMKELNHGKVS